MICKKALLLLTLFLHLSLSSSSQNYLRQKLSALPSITCEELKNTHFKEYYQVMVEQLLDHNDPKGKTFKQRIFIGYSDSAAPTVMETDGYSISSGSDPGFIDEPAKILDGNMILVEHRYFGRSVPETLDWNFLTAWQAAMDYHFIRELFRQVLRGKWISSGVSKGGQAALAYKMYFPDDVDASILYSTPVKNDLNDKRIADQMEKLAGTSCGKKIRAFQLRLLQNKKILLPQYEALLGKKKISFGTRSLETVFEYSVLEYPFSFWQNGHDSSLVPGPDAKPEEDLAQLVLVIPPAYYSLTNLERQLPAYYMSYHQFGYYEYNTEPFRKYLSKNAYPNSAFAPGDTQPDNYLSVLNTFTQSTAMKHVLFVYGGSDPWAAALPLLSPASDCLIATVKNGSHKSRIKDLDGSQKVNVTLKLSAWLGFFDGK